MNTHHHATRAAAVALALAVLSLAGCLTLSTVPGQYRFRTVPSSFTFADKVVDVALSPDGTLIAGASFDGTVKVWERNSGRLVVVLRHPDGVYSVRFFPDGRKVVTGCRDNSVRVFSLPDGRELLSMEGHSMPVYAVAVSPDGELIASGSEDLSVRLWDAGDGSQVAVLTGHTGAVNDVAFSPDGSRLASASSDRTIRLWRASDGALVKVLRASLKDYAAPEFSLDFSADGKWIASAGKRGASPERSFVRLWSVSSGKVVTAYTGQVLDLWDIQFAGNDSYLVAAGREGKLYVWNRETGRLSGSLEVHSGAIWAFAFADGERRLYLATSRNRIQLMQTER